MNGFKLTDLQEKWLSALESGEFQQTQFCLFDGVGYCCLGVACVVAGVEPEKADPDAPDNTTNWLIDGETGVPPQQVVEKLHLKVTGQFSLDHAGTGTGCLIDLNDEVGLTFEQIAAEIRANPQLFFTKGAE